MTSVHRASTAFSQPSVADSTVNVIHTTANAGAHQDSEDKIVWTLCVDPCPTVNSGTPGKAIPANARMAGAGSTVMSARRTKLVQGSLSRANCADWTANLCRT